MPAPINALYIVNSLNANSQATSNRINNTKICSANITKSLGFLSLATGAVDGSVGSVAHQSANSKGLTSRIGSRVTKAVDMGSSPSACTLFLAIF